MSSIRTPLTRRVVAALGILAVLGGILALGIVGGSAAAVDGGDSPSSDAMSGPAAVGTTATASDDGAVSEEAYREPVPEPGDYYFEAAADDGSWVSYLNPRDEYRSPYLGDGSGKICVTLVNEAGEPIVGETAPNTTITVPTGEELEWHSHADPMVVEYPLTDRYERPLDGDQFGTNPDLAQGDGYLDTHCLEMHGQPEDATIEYGEAEIDGEHADRIEVVGYIQQQPEGDGWDSDIDPVDDAVSYEEAGGGWTYRTDASHGQVVVVAQVTEGADDGTGIDDGNGSSSDDSDGNGSGPSDDEPSTQNESGSDSGSDGDDTDTSSGADGVPGFGALIAALALSIVLARHWW